jgi:hypothetical protein
MSKVIIQNIISNIRENKDELIEEQLALLPIEFLSMEQANILLAMFLNEVLLHKNKNLTRMLIDTFDVVRIRTDPLPAVTQLFTNSHVAIEVLKFVILCYPEKRTCDYFLDLINSTDDRLAVEAGNLLTKLCPEMDGATWKYLYSLTESFDEEPYHNPLLRAFFELELNKIRPILGPPEYVRDLPLVSIEPIPFDLPTAEEAIDIILCELTVAQFNFVSMNDKKLVDIKEPLMMQYAISTFEEKRRLLSNKIPEFDDSPIFREYGPVNNIYKHDYLDKDHECKKWGGCRMFLCNEFELNGDDIMAEEPEHVDWFTGECSECKIIIPFRHYAVRKPLINGGWQGCYCNECLTKVVKDSKNAILFDRMQEQLMAIGIRKR